MKRKFIPVEESFKKWKRDPKYVAAYDALEKEFAIASAMIKARAEADMTQEQVAKAMGTTQAVIARLESGRFCPRPAPWSVSRKPPNAPAHQLRA